LTECGKNSIIHGRSDWKYVKNVNCLDCGSMQWMSSDEVGASFVEVRVRVRVRVCACMHAYMHV